MTVSTHISTSGGLISTAFIENIREPGSRQGGVEPESFDLPWSKAPGSPAAMEETVAAAWELVLERWDAVRAGLPAMDVSQVRARWLLPLFQVLDFDPVYLRGDTVLDREGRLRFSLSHRGWDGDGAPILHTVLPAQELDNRPRAGQGAKARSPHDMLQAYLNASPGDRWALLSNGILLRLLREYHHTFTKGYVQFDLESILETRNYGDFRALYRMCHASRFLPPPSPVADCLPMAGGEALSPPSPVADRLPLAGGEALSPPSPVADRLPLAGGEALSPPSPVDRLRAETGEGGRGGEGLCPLEQFYKDSIATGIKIGEDLRGQVRRAIETLGNGFLDGELIGSLQADAGLCQDYYGEILRIIYRVLFLLYAEQRGMMPGRDSLYAEVYSISALRARAEGDLPREDDFCDLWEGLKVTFRMVREGADELSFYTTLEHTLLRALMVAFQLDESELASFLAPGVEQGVPQRVVLYETAVGGSGVLASLAEAGRLATAVQRGRELLHEGDPTGGCERACYECLLSFYNQRDHGRMDRRLALPWLQGLEGAVLEPEVSPDAFADLEAQCQSDLERSVLHAIRERGLPLPDAAQETLYDTDGGPLAIADLYYRRGRVAVWVDGSPHHLDYVQAADERKRRRLKALGYRIVVIAGEDPQAGLDDLASRV